MNHVGPEASWASNVTADEAGEWLVAGGDVVLLTHSKPDGDAAGSTLALSKSLRAAGIDARVWFMGPLPPWLNSLRDQHAFDVLAEGDDIASALGDPERVAILDTGSWTQLHEVSDWLRERRDRVLVMDHHLHGDGDVGDRLLVQATSAAACQVVAPVCCRVLEVRGPSELPQEVAEFLYLGLATDTGWFRHSNVSADVMALASALLSAGVEPTQLYGLVEQQDNPARWQLLGCALRSLELLDGGRIALMSLRDDDFKAAGADRGDTGGFADTVQSIATVEVSAVLTEIGTSDGGMTKISLRSKPGPKAVDVNEVARALGGGGHARAAGVRVAGNVEVAREKLLGVLRSNG